MTKKIADWKKKEVGYIKKDMANYSVIGIVNMINVPSAQLQKMRFSLKKSMIIKMHKARLIKIAINELKETKKGIADLLPYVKGMPAIIYSKENPFKMSKALQKSKTNAPAKIGQLAPNDITIPAGPTQFTPGPIIGELGQLGLKTQVVDGKIHIKDDKKILKEGDIINAKVASVLSKLKIEPMEIGLNLTAAYEDGIIYKKDILMIDDKAYINQIKNAHLESIKLAFSIEYPEKSILELLIKKSYLEGKALSQYIKFDTEVGKDMPKREHKNQRTEEQKEKKKEKPEKEQPESKIEKKEEPKSEIKNESGNTGKSMESKPVSDEEFKELEKQAKDILNKLQEEKMKNHQEPVKKEEPKINKGPKAEDLIKK